MEYSAALVAGFDVNGDGSFAHARTLLTFLERHKKNFDTASEEVYKSY
jgi:hypothetical protein